ncbi:siderophore ABC transporter substrate-binding protein [Garicola koreensis]|uniref:Iron complex transport system substrate-binding protein n=1 Tax=Garicola koreensis TaxID=1262554 RepID=A0A7W5U318_9MICC|nr:ABC transporter substrate-binding protein [Garicola koreensis]MBB3668221.1 iron complex transport system substrate-binding protein [Garicola koreensis]
MTLESASAGVSARGRGFLSLTAIGVLALTACSPASGEATDGSTETANPADSGETVTVEDDHGTHEINLGEVDSIGAFDNRSFRTLEEFGVELSVAARSLMDAQTHGYADDEDILDTGSHREPDLEQIIAAEPDLIIGGQRYSEYYQEISNLTQEAGYDTTVLEFDEAVNSPETFVDGLMEKTQSLGKVFGEEEKAQQLVDDFQTEIDRVKENYDGESTVMGLMTSGGDIQYLAAETGRTIGPLFPTLDLVSAMEQEAEDESHGDDISVEAIAQADPDWLLVIDRDARIEGDGEDYQPADELIAESPALQDVTAVEEGNIVYTPDNMYLTEDIQAYTEFLGSFADALESSQ